MYILYVLPVLRMTSCLYIMSTTTNLVDIYNERLKLKDGTVFQLGLRRGLYDLLLSLFIFNGAP